MERHGKRYHFSWLEVGKDTKFEWEEARNYCRRQCMDSVSIRSKAEMNTIKQALRRDVLRYINTTNSQIFWQIVLLQSSGMNRLCFTFQIHMDRRT